MFNNHFSTEVRFYRDDIVQDNNRRLFDIANDIELDYGSFSFIKQIPNAVWGDTIKTHKTSGNKVSINDMSQLFFMEFESFVNLNEIVNILELSGKIEYAHGPVRTMSFEDPDDPDYQNDLQWYLETINAPVAWDITTGNSEIKVAIIDSDGFDSSHEDLEENVDTDIGDSDFNGSHGTNVAGIVSAVTDNGTGIASLGWSLTMVNYKFDHDPDGGYSSLAADISSASQICDIIVMCFGTYEDIDVFPNGDGTYKACRYAEDYESVNDAVENAISAGVIVVAAYGNRSINIQAGYNYCVDTEYDDFPTIPYPASYPNVIGVTGTTEEDEFVDYYNYQNSLNGYGYLVDVSAPAINIHTTDENDGYDAFDGTSLAAPQVAALSGLILSMRSSSVSFSIESIQNIITSTAEEIDASECPQSQGYNSDGWNPCLGYGRIDAYEALKLVNDSPSSPSNLKLAGSVGQNPRLSWNKNNEVDVENYKIYRKRTGLDNTYLPIATVFNSTFYTDQTITINLGPYVYYKIKALDIAGNTSSFSNRVKTKYNSPSSKMSNGELPTSFELNTAFPNPFNSNVKIKYSLAEKSHVNISVYGIKGNFITNLENSVFDQGFYYTSWDGKTDHRKNVSSGIYLINYKTEKYFDQLKILYVK